MLCACAPNGVRIKNASSVDPLNSVEAPQATGSYWIMGDNVSKTRDDQTMTDSIRHIGQTKPPGLSGCQVHQ